MFGNLSKRAWRLPSYAVVLATALISPPARAAVVVDHQPHNFGGPASDTLLIHPMTGQPSWQLAADSFILPVQTQIKTIRWWGFYDSDNPPTTEIMRIRFHDSRTDGLPGSVLFDYEVTNPIRIDTGRHILTGILPHEYRYRVDLPQTLALQSNTQYWLQISVLGDIDSHFRWVQSQSERNGNAFLNPNVSDWTSSAPTMSDLSLQLVDIPEPSTAAFVIMFAIFALRNSRTTMSSGMDDTIRATKYLPGFSQWHRHPTDRTTDWKPALKEFASVLTRKLQASRSVWPSFFRLVCR